MPTSTNRSKLGDMDYGIDIHGYPTDPAHPSNRPSRWTLEEERAEFFQRHLRVLVRAWVDGSLAALIDAVRWCQRYNLPLPKQIADGITTMLGAASKSGRRGRLAGHAENDRQNRIHYIRWDAVRELRDRRAELAPLGYRPTWDAAFDNASEKLRGSEAAGSAEAIARSYKLVQKLFRSGKGARFYS